MCVCVLAFIFFFLWIIFGDLRSWIVLLTSKLWVEMWRINLSPLWKSGFVFNAWLSGMMVLMELLHTIVLYPPAAKDTVMELFYLREIYLNGIYGLCYDDGEWAACECSWCKSGFTSLVFTQYFRYDPVGWILFLCVQLFLEIVELWSQFVAFVQFLEAKSEIVWH